MYDFPYKLTDLHCQISGHSCSQIIGFCVDENCTILNKFLCMECVFDCHPQHKIVKLRELDRYLNENLKEYMSKKEKEAQALEKFKDKEELIKKEISTLKESVLALIDMKIKDFYQEVKNSFCSNSDKVGSSSQFDMRFDNFMNAKNVPNSNNELENLSELFTEIYQKYSKDSNNKTTKSSPSFNLIKDTNDSDSNNSKNEFTNEFFDNFQTYINGQKKILGNFFQNNFLKSTKDIFVLSVFEWCTKQYGSYGFYYDLKENNTCALKKELDGTISVVRSKDKLVFGNKYKIKFKISIKSGGDFDVGVGLDDTGKNCWLRGNGAYCLSSAGVYCNSKNIDTKTKLKDGDIVTLEIDLISKEYKCNAYINNNHVYQFNLNLNSKELYIMAAIRKVGNQINVLEYQVSNK